MLIRAHKGLYDHTLIEWLKPQGNNFVIVARPTAPVKRKIVHPPYVSSSEGLEVAEFRYQLTRWLRSCRFVVIRRPQAE